MINLLNHKKPIKQPSLSLSLSRNPHPIPQILPTFLKAPLTLIVMTTIVSLAMVAKSWLLPIIINSDYDTTQTQGLNIAVAVGAGVSLQSIEYTNAGDNTSVTDKCQLTKNGLLSTTGVLTSCKVTVTIRLNTTAGYTVKLSSNSSTLSSTNLIGTANPSNTITPTTGNLTTPVALTNGQWGYAMPYAQAVDETNANAPLSGFDPANPPTNPDYAEVQVDATTPSPTDTIHLNKKYAQVPTNTAPDTIRITNTSTNNTDYTFDIYIATRLNFNQPADVYNGTVLITIDANTPPPPEPTPPPSYTTKATSIVPNFASTTTPSGNGTGTNGPQFSIVGTGFGTTPTVTIGGQPCTDVTVNSTGTAMTCTGPVTGMSDGEQRVVINGTDAGDNYTVWYSSYAFPTLQSLTATGTCQGTAAAPVIYRDSRDSQLYYVAKLADNKCWMLDNLRYKPNGDTSGTVTAGFAATQVANTGSYLTADGSTSSTGTNLDSPKYIDPIAETSNGICSNNTGKSAQNISKCGLLYNFYTATAGTAPQSQTTQGSTASGSICPVNWRLPTGYDVNGDFAILNGSMNAGSLAAGSTSTGTGYYENWQSSGAWRGLFSGLYSNAFGNQGSSGCYWSSSVFSATNGYFAYFDASYVYPGMSYYNRLYGFAVRCVL